MRLALLQLCVLSACVALTGCGNDQQSSSSSATTTSSSTTSTAQADASSVADLLGATIGPAPDDKGALVLKVNAASSARLRPGDVITAVDGKQVSSADELSAVVGTPELGQGYTFDVVRGSHRFQVGEVLSPTVYVGIEVKKAGAGESGLLVKSIDPDGPAADSELEPGDVITAVDEEQVSSVSQLLEQIGVHQAGDTVSLSVTRGSDQTDVTVTVADRPER
jgi:S1-C subfamily serine protease